MDTSAVPEGQLSDDELLRAALSAWADQTQELLRWIESQGDGVSDTRTPKQVMALGSFRTHLVMGLKSTPLLRGLNVQRPTSNGGHHNIPQEQRGIVRDPVDHQDRIWWLSSP